MSNSIMEDLNGMEVDQLREQAALLGAAVHHKAGKPTIIAAIAEHIMKQEDAKKPKQNLMEPPKEEYNSPDDIRKMLAPIIEKKPEFTASFDKDEESGNEFWTFRYKGAEDCGTCHQRMKHIKTRAESVARGKRSLRAFGGDAGFDSGVGKGYAQNVLM